MRYLMKTTVAVMFIVLSSMSAFSQNTSAISGKVQYKGKGVPYLTVSLYGSTKGCITDEAGIFTLNEAPVSEVELVISGIGFKTIKHTLTNTGEVSDLIFNIEKDHLLLDEVVISGSRVGLLRYLPGSVSIIQTGDLSASAPICGNEILRDIPGVHVVDEEGAGLRINIGVRGLDPDKSRNVLVLEDGVPVALAPYGEPEMYYTPNIERMSGVEVLKGNGSILFGPQTVGGVVNYLTADPPLNSKGLVSVKGGNYGFNSTFVNYGNTLNNIGFDLNFNRKQAENFGTTRFLLHDINTKLLLSFSQKSKLVLKLSVYDENSNSTYAGITQAMYDVGGYDYLRIAPDDKLHIRRYATSASHKLLISDALELNTLFFAYTTSRNWIRQDFTYDSEATNLSGVVHGIEGLKEGAIYMRNRTGQRNRRFEVTGIEPRLTYRYRLFEYTSRLDAGVRYLYEKAYEQRINGTKAGVLSGNLHEDEIRTGNAVSAFVQNKILLGNNLSLTFGLRNEHIFYSREIFRLAGNDTLIENNTKDATLIPGFGINYIINEKFCVFTGIHKGYAPPRTKDAISNEGVDMELEAEKSWNYELGVRSDLGMINFELTGFYMNFSNQVIPVSESSGGAGAGYINGGKTTHLGAEMAMMFRFYKHETDTWKTAIRLSGTYVNSRFTSDRYVLQKKALNNQYDDVFVNVKGNKTPYAPKFSFNGALTLEYKNNWGMKLTGNYIGKQFTDALNTNNVHDYITTDANDPNYNYVQATLNGRTGLMKAYFISDASMWFTPDKSRFAFNASVKNILNERYIASRRPQGIRVGMPRLFIVGVSYRF